MVNDSSTAISSAGGSTAMSMQWITPKNSANPINLFIMVILLDASIAQVVLFQIPH
jgi:hypothetical protein